MKFLQNEKIMMSKAPQVEEGRSISLSSCSDVCSEIYLLTRCTNPYLHLQHIVDPIRDSQDRPVQEPRQWLTLQNNHNTLYLYLKSAWFHVLWHCEWKHQSRWWSVWRAQLPAASAYWARVQNILQHACISTFQPTNAHIMAHGSSCICSKC